VLLSDVYAWLVVLRNNSCKLVEEEAQLQSAATAPNIHMVYASGMHRKSAAKDDGSESSSLGR